MAGPRWLEHKAQLLRETVAERPDDGAAQLDLGIAEKLLGGIEPAFLRLRRALANLPQDDVQGRQRALFVLGLTWGDVRRYDEAVRCFEAVEALAPASRIGEAARGYAASYREVHGV